MQRTYKCQNNFEKEEKVGKLKLPNIKINNTVNNNQDSVKSVYRLALTSVEEK